jgi:hypothetical protein
VIWGPRKVQDEQITEHCGACVLGRRLEGWIRERLIRPTLLSPDPDKGFRPPIEFGCVILLLAAQIYLAIDALLAIKTVR